MCGSSGDDYGGGIIVAIGSECSISGSVLSGCDGFCVDSDGDFGIGQYVGMVFRYRSERYVVEWCSYAIDIYSG